MKSFKTAKITFSKKTVLKWDFDLNAQWLSCVIFFLLCVLMWLCDYTKWQFSVNQYPFNKYCGF